MSNYNNDENSLVPSPSEQVDIILDMVDDDPTLSLPNGIERDNIRENIDPSMPVSVNYKRMRKAFDFSNAGPDRSE